MEASWGIFGHVRASWSVLGVLRAFWNDLGMILGGFWEDFGGLEAILEGFGILGGSFGRVFPPDPPKNIENGRPKTLQNRLKIDDF